MVRHVADISKLDEDIHELLKKFKKDDQKIIKFLAATLDKSTRFNLYTEYLRKNNRHSGAKDSGNTSDLFDLIKDFLMLPAIKVICISLLINIIHILTRMFQCVKASRAIATNQTSFTRDVNKLEDLAKEKFKRRYCASVNNATAGLFLSYELFSKTKKLSALTLW